MVSSSGPLGYEEVMGATFDDSALLDDADGMGVADGGEAVGNDNGGAPGIALQQLEQVR